MNKIEQMHLDAIQLEQSSDITQHGSIIEFVSSDNYYDLAVKSAEITEQIAIEFAEWIYNSGYMWNWRFKVYTLSMIPSEKEAKITGKSTKELFQEFLKTKQ